MRNIKEYIMPVVVLMVICLATTFALAGTYNLTAETIEKVSKEAADNARKTVLPDADSFTEVSEVELDEGITEIYVADNGVGAVITAQDRGFGGTITVMVSFDAEGKIVTAEMTEHAETPGLGTKVQDESYTSQYNGKTSLEEISAITGATISSKAVERCVQKALDQYAKLGGKL